MPPPNQPDLASILQVLAQSTKTSPAQLRGHPPPHLPQHPPPTHHPQHPNHTSASTAATTIARPAAPAIDPTVITTWPPALRRTTTLVATDSQARARLRTLLTTQARNQQQWWADRTALIRTQSTRAASRAQLTSLLRGVGGTVDPTLQAPTPEEEAAEVARFDAKVYRATKQMHEAGLVELKALGIPFFCLREDLVVEADGKGSEGKVSAAELRRLREKMLELLADLIGEE